MPNGTHDMGDPGAKLAKAPKNRDRPMILQLTPTLWVRADHITLVEVDDLTLLGPGASYSAVRVELKNGQLCKITQKDEAAAKAFAHTLVARWTAALRARSS